MPFCPTCNEYAYGPGHQCPPQWHVWQEGTEDGYDPDEARIVYADSAKDAALKFADEHSDDGPWEDDLFVRAVGEESEPVCYAIDHYLQPVYEASPRKPKAALAPSIKEGTEKP